MSLNNPGNRQSALGQREAALISTQEAVDIRRQLAAARRLDWHVVDDGSRYMTRLFQHIGSVGRGRQALTHEKDCPSSLASGRD